MSTAAIRPVLHRPQPAPSRTALYWRGQGLLGLCVAVLTSLALVLATSLSLSLAPVYDEPVVTVPLGQAQAFSLQGDFTCPEDAVATLTPDGIGCLPANPGLSSWDSSLAASDLDDNERVLLLPLPARAPALTAPAPVHLAPSFLPHTPWPPRRPPRALI